MYIIHIYISRCSERQGCLDPGISSLNSLSHDCNTDTLCRVRDVCLLLRICKIVAVGTDRNSPHSMSGSLAINKQKPSTSDDTISGNGSLTFINCVSTVFFVSEGLG